jgi:hypothetical protein
MGKKKNKAKKCLAKKCSKFFVNGKPMSQVVHWSIILGIFGLYAIKMVEAKEILDNVYGI